MAGRPSPARRAVGLLAVVPSLVPLLSGCERDPVRIERGRPLAVVQGVAVSGADSVFIRASRVDVSGREGPLAGASLTVAGPDDAVTRLEEVGGGACGMPSEVTCYRGPLAAPLGTADRIGLSGTLPESGPVQGSAVVPPAPVVLDSAGRRLTEKDTLETALPRPLGYYSVAWIPLREVSADTRLAARDYPADVELESGGRPAGECTVAARIGTITTDEGPVPTLRLDPPLCGGRYVDGWSTATLRITFLRFDPPFAAYLDANASLAPLPAEMGSVNVTGVHGALGAATPLDVTVRTSSEAGASDG